jgi:SAM-dependent methyltransferase
LRLSDEVLLCDACPSSYPAGDEVPDFILEDLTKSTNPTLRGVKDLDRLARIYETRFWYPLVLNFYGGLGAPSMEQLARITADLVPVEEGYILDAACGPGTIGRRIASERKAVYGTDISMGMLRKGLSYAKRDNILNIRFARAKVEALPFPDCFFDGAVCGGALHLFADTVEALREIGRTIKDGALLAVMTFTAGSKGILRSRRIREGLQEKHRYHIFQLSELEEYLAKAGFEGFRPQLYGSILVFSARKTGL